MAEISNAPQKNAGGKVRSKKLSTKIDMTPMVDLAFLLLTFFILTTSFNKARVMALTMPEQPQDSTSIPRIMDKDVMNVVLAENDKVYWWMGLEPSAASTNYSREGVRKILLEKRNANPDLMVLIKPKDNSKYENIIDILDEIEITNMKRYAIVDFTDVDKTRIPED